MKKLLALSIAAVLSICSVQADAITLNSSGATFPAPLYGRWFAEYNKLHTDVQINYQSVGSGQGIKSFVGGLTDFGASDAAMSDADIASVKDGGVVLLPMTAGSIVLSYNLPGVTTAIQLPRDVYPAIFLGKITKWNDPKIAAANPGMTLPDMPITVAYRADGSGTTYNFTNHLAAISGGHQRGLQGRPGQRENGQVARRCRWQRQRRCCRADQANAGNDRLRRVWLRPANQAADGCSPEFSRQVCRADARLGFDRARPG
jgi:phosphate transport system substrate-binding protein